MGARETPQEVARLSEECVRDVREELGFDLDYTVETLPVVDHYCRTARKRSRWPDGAEHIAETVGAYFGEVIRGRFKKGCRWHLGAEGLHAWRLEFEHFFLCFNPLGAALELLLEGQAHGWNADFVTLPEVSEDLENHLDNLPGVSEDDYYTLSVRYEVLETIQAFLVLWQHAQEETRSAATDTGAASRTRLRKYRTADYDKRLAQLLPDLAAEFE
jgi:hypothetical protein